MLYEITACIGLTFILKYGSIFNFPREFLIGRGSFFKDLFDCSLCLGFWSGAAVGMGLFFLDWNSFYYLLPLVSAFCSLAADSLLRATQTWELYLEHRTTNSIWSKTSKQRRRKGGPPCPDCKDKAVPAAD